MKRLKFYEVLRFIALTTVILIFLSVFYGVAIDIKLLDENKTTLSLIFKEEYFANFVISPLWVLVAYLVNKANEIENGEWKGQKNQLLGLIKGKDQVAVIDIREIVQNEYNQEAELDEMRREREKLKIAKVPADELKF